MSNNNKSDLDAHMSMAKPDDYENEMRLTEGSPQHLDINQTKFIARMWYYVRYSAKKTYSACTVAGDKIAWLFGITKPKYHAELQHYDRMNDEEREAWRQAFQDIEHADHIRESIR